MASLTKTQLSLQHRVNDFLRSNPLAYAVEEPKEESVEAIFSLLKRAEDDLKIVQERVNLLKWELEKAQS